MSDEVSQFLEQVERLRGQQIEEDEVRARDLEQYLAAKRERQARREERARSISPQKSSPANTPSPRSSQGRLNLSDAVKLDSPRAPAADYEVGKGEEESTMLSTDSDPMDYSSSPTKENEAPGDGDTKRTGTSSPTARGSPLSWQRRPNSRGGVRPLSMVAAQNATQRSLAGPQEPQSATEQSFSKDQIAQALGSKDPSWFRQTPDRGQGSAAYRRNQVEDDDRLDMSSVRSQLPGMSPDPVPDRPPSQPSTSTSQGRLASPLPLNPPTVDGSGEEKPLNEGLPLSPTGRLSPTRSTSPTKGMGGFVQSAMMKRTDSVKRWSVTSPTGLTRADSVASHRNAPQARSRPQSMVRGGSGSPTRSRPESTLIETNIESNATSKATVDEPDTEVNQASREREDDARLPTSPSKTMDSRRWSPTKSSWLENAITKQPESPKPQHRGQSSQPAWMVELNKNKTSSPSGDPNRPVSVSHKHQVSISGLMRSSPLGEGAKPNTTGLGGIYSPPPGGNRSRFGHGAKPSFSQNKAHPSSEDQEDTTEGPSEAEVTETPAAVMSPSDGKPMLKPKPETPPKKDFRANLKPRPADGGNTKGEEAEFKNVFGKLRKTRTQNYVAPDELKDNVLRGKAALNLTGGPQKTERKDEFKDAILKKKDDFKKTQAEGKGITRSVTTSFEKPVPEGLAKRAQLGKPSQKQDSASEMKSPKQSTKPSPGPKRISSQPGLLAKSPSAPAVSESTKSSSADTLKRVTTEPQPTTESRPLPVLQKETAAPAKLQSGRVGGGKLAERFSPALAGMLARGPPPIASERGQSGESRAHASSTGGDGVEASAPGPQLTHMTKSRARGPRRKAPTSSAAPPASSSPVEMAASKPKGSHVGVADPVSKSANVRRPDEEITNPEEVVKPLTPGSNRFNGGATSKPPMSIQQQVAAKAAVRGKPSPKPTERSFDNFEQVVKPVQHLGSRPRGPDTEMQSRVSAVDTQGDSEDASRPGSPNKLDMKRMSKFLDEAKSNGSISETVKEPAQITHLRSRSRSPTKVSERPLPEPTVTTPAKANDEPLASGKNPMPKSPPIGPKPTFDRAAREVKSPGTPSKAFSRPTPVSSHDDVRSDPIESPVRSPAKPTSELSAILADFFGPQQPRKALRVDAAEILSRRPLACVKIRTQRFQMFQITGDGKKVPVPQHHEHVLFEREMYICPHDFVTEAGRRVLEVYFWVGDDVPESSAEDAQLFAQREARSLGGRLVKLRQGKETTEFLQALGGVVIVRRGSSNKYDSLAPNMLCGRQYLSHVAFDEVDFSASTLCAGFPYLLTQGGKCYLWKGKGSNVDELSCARLLGMDLTLTGELLEYDDGSEPASFWDMFEDGSSKKPHSADHWRLKPNYSKYCGRLFCSDADSRQQIFEISPFCQGDLSNSSIYILDAFFEMYIIVGGRAQSQYASFRNALDFAQEYTILAAGMEDRPFVPFCTVVLEGAPRDLKSVFRKWTDAGSPTIMNAAAAGLRRGRSLRVVPLTQALQALGEGR